MATLLPLSDTKKLSRVGKFYIKSDCDSLPSSDFFKNCELEETPEKNVQNSALDIFVDHTAPDKIAKSALDIVEEELLEQEKRFKFSSLEQEKINL